MGADTRSAGPIVLAALLLLSGCAQVAIHSTVAADGSIDEYRMEITTSRTAYGFLEQSAEERGFDSVRAAMLSDVEEEWAQEVEYAEEFDGDEVTMTVTATEFEPPADSTISITERDGHLVYEDLTFVNESARPSADAMSGSVLAGLAVDYYLTMPGEIVDTNADTVDGRTAEWHATGADSFTDTRIYAVSEKPAIPSLSGFGIGVALLAVLTVVLAARAARDGTG